MTTFKPHEPLTEQVARHVEELIVFGRLKSGERIYENAMARDLDVSHGSVREGLLLLEKRHLVRNIPRKGTFVTRLDRFFVRSLYDLLTLYLCHTGRKLARKAQARDLERLESLYRAMQECAQHNDLLSFLNLGIDYTQASLAYADNHFIVSAIDDLWPSAKRCTFVAFMHGGHETLNDNLIYMRQSLDAIARHDEEGLCEIIQRYARQQGDHIAACLESANGSR